MLSGTSWNGFFLCQMVSIFSGKILTFYNLKRCLKFVYTWENWNQKRMSYLSPLNNGTVGLVPSQLTECAAFCRLWLVITLARGIGLTHHYLLPKCVGSRLWSHYKVLLMSKVKTLSVSLREFDWNYIVLRPKFKHKLVV